jgi:hypothetical protein
VYHDLLAATASSMNASVLFRTAADVCAAQCVSLQSGPGAARGFVQPGSMGGQAGLPLVTVGVVGWMVVLALVQMRL